MTFNGLVLETAPGRVMTPRTTSECLVAEACRRVRGPARIADVGTGSGALAIAIAIGCPEARVWATDVDPRAVVLARENAYRYGVQSRVSVLEGDLLEPVPGALDVVVANLPYLPASEAVHHADLRGEPFAAVFAGGDGLGVCRRLVDAASSRLSDTGTLLLQLYGRVVSAERAELPALREALDAEALVAYAA